LSLTTVKKYRKIEKKRRRRRRRNNNRKTYVLRSVLKKRDKNTRK
jgi:hypothetical protein